MLTGERIGRDDTPVSYHREMTPASPCPEPLKRPDGLQLGARPAPSLEVFLSHSASDKVHIDLVCLQLQALGISVYLAEHDYQPGRMLAQKVSDAIHRCHAVVVLITTASVNSAYVQQEVGIAHECEKPIVPIVEKGIDTRQLGILQGIEYLELDLEHPADTMAKMTASLQPLVLKQLSSMKVSFSVTQTTVPDPATAFLLIGLGLILGLIVFEAISAHGEGG